MLPLDKSFQIQLEKIIEDLQASEDLASYLEEEEDSFYNNLKNTYEPQIREIYDQIATNNPLQMVSFEEALLDERLEGMFLPRILGYAALRGEYDSNYKYIRPQNHFRAILFAICTSSNFDILKQRIGQTIQVGFALSSDIWITNFLNEIPNKKIRQFLSSQKMPAYREVAGRRALMFRYKNQFKTENFYTCDFPSNKTELQIMASSIKTFLLYRVQNKLDNSSVRPPLVAMLDNADFMGMKEHDEVLQIYANFFPQDSQQGERTRALLAESRKSETFNDNWISGHLDLQEKGAISAESDMQARSLFDLGVQDDISNFYNLMGTVHEKGFIHEDSVEGVRGYLSNYEGLSDNNQVVRNTILQYIDGIFSNLSEESYTEYFELSKIFPVYIDIFGNEEFNQELKDSCVSYVKRLKKRFTDKRGKDYQDIKKFVMANFIDLGFMKEKQIVEFFKTKRKKKPTPA
ncbi:MAG: hypothetical protein HKN16_03005 [Saprospiraceae bacterium]|nr:hypothetical protein [Saprospiraceae bacterium]